MESKPHERIDLLITESVNINQRKKEKKYSNSNENILFWRKTNKTIWKPPFLREPPFTLTPPISEQFFRDPLFVQILNARTPRLILGGWNYVMALVIISDRNQKLLDEVLVKILINFTNFF